ncbi:ATP-binding protein [Paenibacillus xylanilyticus]|uniref:ATP-binding protein n=1 Tax=Paenibacillus xylanilyticus TaxID=248903 RepID=A0A7Y6BUS1_9BACL|nr:ATP-binding protein [Paenibacillus xylanilyticus]NUU75388.1 ATP-binding protein [Paenibacillus xylanilyticus]
MEIQGNLEELLSTEKEQNSPPSLKRPLLPKGAHPVETGKYDIPTNEINNLYARVKESIEDRLPGTVVHGRPRLGKTRAIAYLMKALPMDFEKLPMYNLLCREHTKPNEDVFFTEILKDIGHGFYSSRNAVLKRERLLKFLIEQADAAGQNRTVFFLDDAQRLHEIQYGWLMDISNELDRYGINLTVFLVGQNELLNQRSVFFEEEKYQIIGRFMVEPYKFHGIRSEDDLNECLLCYDEGAFYPYDSAWSFTRYYFPESFEKEEFRLSNYSKQLFDVFVSLRQEAGISKSFEIPMQYVTRTIEFALKKYGCEGNDVESLNQALWKRAIKSSGYIEAEIYRGPD